MHPTIMTKTKLARCVVRLVSSQVPKIQVVSASPTTCVLNQVARNNSVYPAKPLRFAFENNIDFIAMSHCVNSSCFLKRESNRFCSGLPSINIRNIRIRHRLQLLCLRRLKFVKRVTSAAFYLNEQRTKVLTYQATLKGYYHDKRKSMFQLDKRKICPEQDCAHFSTGCCDGARTIPIGLIVPFILGESKCTGCNDLNRYMIVSRALFKNCLTVSCSVWLVAACGRTISHKGWFESWKFTHARY